MRIEIKNRWTGNVLFAHEAEENTLAITMVQCLLAQRGTYLRGADDNNLCATPEESIANLDKVREIILNDKARLQMGHWHGDDAWVDRTCAEETICGTTHCLAGWLQVCSTKPEIRQMDANLAGILSAPVASKMFFRGPAEVLNWLETRAYAEEAMPKVKA